MLYGNGNTVVLNGELAVPTKNGLTSSARLENLCSWLFVGDEYDKLVGYFWIDFLKRLILVR